MHVCVCVCNRELDKKKTIHSTDIIPHEARALIPAQNFYGIVVFFSFFLLVVAYYYRHSNSNSKCTLYARTQVTPIVVACSSIKSLLVIIIFGFVDVVRCYRSILSCERFFLLVFTLILAFNL